MKMKPYLWLLCGLVSSNAAVIYPPGGGGSGEPQTPFTATDNGTSITLNVDAPLVIGTNLQAAGLTLGGVTKTNWGETYIPLELVRVGSGATFYGSATNVPAWYKPALTDSAAAETNYLEYIVFIPSYTPTNPATLHIRGYRTGTAGNAVLNYAFDYYGSNPGANPTYPSGGITQTNAFAGAQARSSYYAITGDGWWQPVSAPNHFAVRISRAGDSSADTLVGDLHITSIGISYQSR